MDALLTLNVSADLAQSSSGKKIFLKRFYYKKRSFSCYRGTHKSSATHGCAIIRLNRRLKVMVMKFLARHRQQAPMRDLSRSEWHKSPIFCGPSGKPCCSWETSSVQKHRWSVKYISNYFLHVLLMCTYTCICVHCCIWRCVTCNIADVAVPEHQPWIYKNGFLADIGQASDFHRLPPCHKPHRRQSWRRPRCCSQGPTAYGISQPEVLRVISQWLHFE